MSVNHIENNYADIQLAALVETFRFIYDQSDKRFKSKSAIDDAWQSISEALSIPVDLCSSRWTVLRARYSTERRKLEQRGGGACDWPVYPHLDFLDKFVRRRNTFGLYRKGDDAPSTGSSTPPSERQGRKSKKGRTEFVEVGEYGATEEVFNVQPDFEVDFMAAERERSPVRKGSQVSLSLDEAAGLIKSLGVTKDSNLSAEDVSIKSFCDSLFYDFKHMDKTKLRLCKIEILKVINEYSQ